MDVLIPLLAFLAGLGVHRRWARWLRSTDRVRYERLRFEARFLDRCAFTKHLQRQDVRREIDQLIEDTRR